jgi:hypothetical protein
MEEDNLQNEQIRKHNERLAKLKSDQEKVDKAAERSEGVDAPPIEELGANPFKPNNNDESE